MSNLNHKSVLAGDFSNRDLRKSSFQQQDLTDANFSQSDLRGADFSDANLTGANLTHTRTGITTLNNVLLFFTALAISLLSGYFAMLAGQTTQGMLASQDMKIRAAGIATFTITILFILYYLWKGGKSAIRELMLPVITVSLIIAMIAYSSGYGTGRGMIFQIVALLLVLVMFVVGTVARIAAGSLSNILFMVVALSGGIFGRSVGGGIGTVVMALSCALISKRALAGALGFERLRRIAFFITRKFGTSFRNSNLAGADFSHANLRNADFTNAELSDVHWGNSRKQNCIINKTIVTEKKRKKTAEST